MVRCIVLFLGLTSLATAQITYLDFSSTGGLALNGSASPSGGVMVLAPASLAQKGSVYFNTPVAVSSGFDTAFAFRISSLSGGGGDGLAFVIHNDPRGTTALGHHASAMGYAKFLTAGSGIAIVNSLVVELDTYSNGFGGVGSDPSPNHISVHTNGTGENTQRETASIGWVTPSINMSDGQIHIVRVRYVPGTLEVFLDDMETPILSIPYDFATGGTQVNSGNPVGGLNLLPGGKAYVGFTASTGGAWQSHELFSWQMGDWEYQLNSPASSLTFNGQPDPGPFQTIRQISPLGQADTLQLSTTNVGFPWDLAIRLPGQGIGRSEGAIVFPDGSVLNLDLTPPQLFFLLGGPLPNLTTTSFPAPQLNMPVTPQGPLQAALQMINVDPAALLGFSLSHCADYEVVTCQLQQDFEDLPLGVGSYPLGWQNGGGTAEWRVHAGPTPSGNTGPQTGAFSGLKYMYCETSGANGGATFIMDSCAMDVSLLASPVLSFRLSRLGSTIGTLNVYQDDGSGGLISLGSYTGPEPSGTDWTIENLLLVPTGSFTVTLRFEYTAGGGATGDLAIDDINVH